MCVRVRVFQDTSSMKLPALFYKIKKEKCYCLQLLYLKKKWNKKIARFGDF